MFDKVTLVVVSSLTLPLSSSSRSSLVTLTGRLLEGESFSLLAP